MTLLTKLSESKPVNVSLLGWSCFQIGLLFLASSALISGLCFLIAFISANKHRFNYFFKDKWNYSLMIISVLMIAGSIGAYSGWLAWIGLANWIPFFFLFWGFQPYLLTVESRKRCALLMLIGTIPVVITGLGQLWFGWEGPWQLFNGLIVWFVARNGNPTGRLSGLFNYANIAGSWLALVWPIALATLLQPSLNRIKRFFAFLLLLSIGLALVLTNSRNAWGGMLLSTPFVLGMNTWFWLLPLSCFLLLPIVFAVVPFVPFDVQFFARKIVPDSLWIRLTDIQFADIRPIETTRIFQWKEAITLLLQKPLFGYGAAAFSVIYPLRQGIWHGHAHNLPLELSISHGLPVGILFVATVLLLLILSFKHCFLTISEKDKIFDRAWWAATFTIVFLHGADMSMFDSRINVAGWILLAGLRSLLTSNDSRRLLDA